MNVNQLINIVTNQVVRRVVNLVVDRGINFASRKVSDVAKPDPAAATPEHVTTPAELAKEAQLRSMADRAAQSARMIRKLRR